MSTLHTTAETDTGLEHKAAEASGDGGTVGEDIEHQDDGSDVLFGLVLFEPRPPGPGLKS